MTVPTTRQLRIAKNAAFGEAKRRRLDEESAKDFIQEAYLGLLDSWPKLVKRYGPNVPSRLITTVVKRRLVDYTRRELGRSIVGQNTRPHIGCQPLEWQNNEGEWQSLQLQSSADVEHDVLVGLDERETARLIDELCGMYGPGQRRNKIRCVLHAIAAGRTYDTAAAEGGFTRQYADVLMSQLRHRLRVSLPPATKEYE